jgi:oxaloacetate decarboxylase alpha subunit
VLRLLAELEDRPSVHDLAVAKPDLRLFVHRRREGAERG